MVKQENLRGNGCGNGLPCVYVSANKWIPYDVDYSYKNYHPPPVKTTSWKNEKSTLFLMIASFRDKLCPHTLYNLYSKAKSPNRIFVGLVQQNLPEDGDCLEEYCKLMLNKSNMKDCPFKENIRIERKDASKAMGPTWARAIGSTLLRDEEFCMQTDAHMDFVVNWDVHMMAMWAATENEYAVLSTYVTDSGELKHNLEGQMGINGLFEVPHLCMVTLQGLHGLVRNWGTKSARMLPHPKLTNAVWGAGLSFSKCHAERKVPYDPHTPGIFDGEEYSRALRYWTYGYDIYTPNRVYVVHDYQVSQADPKHMVWMFNDKSGGIYASQSSSVTRLRILMGMPTAETDELKIQKLRQSRYGLGDRRTLQQAIEFSGIDTIHDKILSNRCGNIEYVPFIEHAKGADYIPHFDPITEECLDEYDEGSVYHLKHNNNNNNNNNNNKNMVVIITNNTRDHVNKKQIVTAAGAVVKVKAAANIALSDISTNNSSHSTIISLTFPAVVIVILAVVLCLLRRLTVTATATAAPKRFQAPGMNKNTIGTKSV